MSRPPAPPCPSAAQPSAAVAAPVCNAGIIVASSTPRHPIPVPFSGRFRPLGASPPAPYPAPFYTLRRPPLFPLFRPPAAFPSPHVYLPPPPRPGGFIPHPGPPFNPFVHPRYITQYPVYQQPLGFPPRPLYPPIGVLSYQRPGVVDGTFGPAAVARPPITFAPVAPADEPQFIVYVGNIASSVNRDFVLSLLQVCGVVKSWNPVTNPIDGTRTAFGFCYFESAEGSLRAMRLLNKLSIDGQELVIWLPYFFCQSYMGDAKAFEELNVNEATKAYLQKFGENTTEENAKEAETETRDEMVSLADNGNDSLRDIPALTDMEAVVGGQMSSQGKRKRCLYDTEEYSDADKDAMQKIRFIIEDRMKSKWMQGREDGEVSPEGKSSLQIDAVSSMQVSMECESSDEHKMKRQHREREEVDLESDATSKSGNEETLDGEQLLAAVPKTKEELFAYDVNWAICDKHGLHEKMRPWITEKTTEIFGEDIPEFVEYVVASTKEHVEAPRILETLGSLMDHSAEKFFLSVWTQLIFEIRKAETGLA